MAQTNNREFLLKIVGDMASAEIHIKKNKTRIMNFWPKK